jgi:hypothetical protein
VVLSLQLGPTHPLTCVRRSSAGGDGIVTLSRVFHVFQDRNRCIPKYNDVIEIYVQVLWLPVYFTLFGLSFAVETIIRSTLSSS